MPLNEKNTIVAEWILVAFSLPFVLLRLWVRGYLQRRFALSDCLIICAWLFLAIDDALDILAWKWGLWSADIRFTAGPLPDFTKAFPDENSRIKVLKLTYIAAVIYYFILYFVKGSFLLFYLKLFPENFVKLRIALYFNIGFTVAGAAVTTLINLFWCLPVRRNWTTNQSDLCISSASVTVYFLTVAFHFISDVMIYTLPFFLLRFLSLCRRKIVSLVMVFSLGILCIVCTIGRTVNVGLSAQFTVIAIWGTSECAAGIIVACCPPLKWLCRYAKRGTGVGGAEAGETLMEVKEVNMKIVTNRGESKSVMFTAGDPDDGYDIVDESK